MNWNTESTENFESSCECENPIIVTHIKCLPINVVLVAEDTNGKQGN
jgi:hypothetical protein